MIEFVSKVIEFAFSTTRLVSNVTEFTISMTEFVSNVTEFAISLIEFVRKTTEFVISGIGLANWTADLANKMRELHASGTGQRRANSTPRRKGAKPPSSHSPQLNACCPRPSAFRNHRPTGMPQLGSTAALG